MRVDRKALFALAAGLVISIFVPRAAIGQDGEKIEGAWLISISAGPGTPSLPNWYRALATFTHDGGVIETITDPNILTGHGRWAKLRGQQYAVTAILFQFDSSGDFRGTLKARATITVDKSGNQFTSDAYTFEIFDRNGTLLLSGTGKAEGTRIVVEPLP